MYYIFQKVTGLGFILILSAHLSLCTPSICIYHTLIHDLLNLVLFPSINFVDLLSATVFMLAHNDQLDAHFRYFTIRLL